jgi:diguanylate cyclase (GGDEF)-like protein
MPVTNEENAYDVVERARLALAARPHAISGKQITISISSGIASLSGDKETVETILNRADAALYRSKNTGRNRVSLERETV